MTDKIVLIAMRLADMLRVHPGQITGECAHCKQVVGIYPSGQQVLKNNPKIEVVCQVCHPPGKSAMLAPGAIDEPFQSVKK